MLPAIARTDRAPSQQLRQRTQKKRDEGIVLHHTNSEVVISSYRQIQAINQQRLIQ